MSQMSSSNAHLEYAVPICECGLEAPIRTSWTEVNPGRRFYGCPNYGTPRGKCRYFEWVDPEFPERAKNVINALIRKIDRVEAEKRQLEKQQRIVQLGKVFVCGAVFVTMGLPIVAIMLSQKN